MNPVLCTLEEGDTNICEIESLLIYQSHVDVYVFLNLKNFITKYPKVRRVFEELQSAL